MMVVFVVVFILVITGVVKGEGTKVLQSVGYSQVQVITLNNMEQRIYDLSTKYLEKLKEQQELVQRFLKLHDTYKPGGRRRSNPIFTYLTMERLRTEVTSIQNNMDTLHSFTSLIEQEMESRDWPGDEDVEKVMMQILNIYHMYDLTVEDLSDGQVHDSDISMTLTASQCFEIGKLAVEEQRVGSGVEWMNMAFRKIINHYPNDQLIIAKYMGVLKSTIEKHDKLLQRHRKIESKLSVQHIWNTDLFDTEIGQLTSFKRHKIRHRHPLTTQRRLSNVTEDILFHQLCSQKFKQVPHHSLFCWYERNLHPFFRINPLKVQLLKRKPYIVQIYNFIDNVTREKLIQVGIPKLVRQQATSIDESGAKTSKFHASLSEYEMSEFDRFLHKVNMVVSGYEAAANSNNPSEFYVSMYSLGGYLEPPIDSMKHGHDYEYGSAKSGDMKLTILAYLNYVHAGAFTSFPKIGVVTEPILGSVVMMFQNARGKDQSPRPCPIVSGQKFIAVHSIVGVSNPFIPPPSRTHQNRTRKN